MESVKIIQKVKVLTTTNIFELEDDLNRFIQEIKVFDPAPTFKINFLIKDGEYKVLVHYEYEIPVENE